MLKGLPPGVEHRDQSNLRAEMLRIGGHRAQAVSGGPHEKVIDHRLVLEGDLGQQCRQREDDMEIGNRQQLGFASLQPFGTGQVLALRTVTIAARVVGDALLATVGALLDMSA